ncbi:MAG: GGDEF domain-containing protein [Aquabacterium sp.]|uniref:GGDEF domain-containing protein n=1 Tax=Aquabacterium sp. TaxID=1872578 RepID=UPI00122B9F1F|nr:GGDEF domain-containing protein [Aquabacterium sp.]TAK95949.1 MAG: GGDEF domain-containing protein [Aquabacterium sp.]
MVRTDTPPAAMALTALHTSAQAERRQTDDAPHAIESGLCLRFPAKWEAQFLQDTSARRISLVLRRSPAVILAFVGILIADWFMVPDRFQMALLLRLLAFLPLYALTLYLFRQWGTSSARDWLLSGSAVLTSLLHLAIVVPSQNPLASAHLATLSVIVVCWDSLLRPAFVPALTNGILVGMGFVASLLAMPAQGGPLAIPVTLLLLSSMVFSLYGNYTLEKAERAAYLLERNQRLLRARLHAAHERLSQQARLDPLTDIPNRRHFDETLPRFWQAHTGQHGEPVHHAHPICVILLDVDFFKPYNDHYGHPAGDRCLHAVAQAIAQCVRQPEDLVARIGGEEFALILRQTSAQEALDVAQRIRSTVKALAIPHHFRPDAMDIVTISQGLSWGQAQSQAEMQALINKADQTLYRAKAQGRDGIATAEAKTPHA